SDITDANGQATFTVASSTAGTVAFAATDVTDANLAITQTATVTFLAGAVADAATSTVVASPADVVADGTATSTITVTLQDANHNAVAGKMVTLTQTSGPGLPVITTVSGTSDVNGQATFTVASTTAATDVFAATDVTDANLAITQTAAVNFTAGPVDAVSSTLAASPVAVMADGSTTSTITATLNDSNNNPVSGKTVTLAQTSGPGSPTITTVTGISSGTGTATFTVKSATAGTDVFTATDVTDANLAITQTATVTFVPPVAWGPATTVTSDTDVATNGVLQYAEHWGGSDGTINGVAFTAAGVNVTKSDGAGATQTVSWSQGSLSATYYNLLRGNWYGAGNASVFLNNLTSGHLYQVQMWSVDKRYETSQTETYAGSPAVSPSIGTGQYAIGTFTASDTTQVIGVSGQGVINAVVVRELTLGGFASWQTANSTAQGLDGDHDNDGVPNGIEYFLGGNTNTTGFTSLPGVTNTGGTLSVTWTKAADYTGAYGTDFVVETSVDLTGDWAPEALGGNVTITGNDVTYTFPSPLGAKKFARLKVTGP
ncbi:MAG: Ig-like domain-containing protein, partial [Verrucomicrobia bacterium]|nr:Ig-like domain-containing protein [Verrucomicrobiota bacterium]